MKKWLLRIATIIILLAPLASWAGTFVGSSDRSRSVEHLGIIVLVMLLLLVIYMARKKGAGS